MDNLPVHILSNITCKLDNNEWATVACVNKSMHEACSMTLAARREEYEVGGKYLKSLLRCMFPQPRQVDALDSYDGQYNYKNMHPFGIDRLVLNQYMLSIAIDKNNKSYKMCDDIIEPLLERMFPPTSRSKPRGECCEPIVYASGDVQIFTTKYKNNTGGGLELFCINLFWADSPMCFTTL